MNDVAKILFLHFFHHIATPSQHFLQTVSLEHDGIFLRRLATASDYDCSQVKARVTVKSATIFNL